MRPDDLRIELEEERDFLLRSLDDLEVEHAGGDLTDDDYRTLGDDYTARAAAVLRRIQVLDGSPGRSDVRVSDARDAGPANGAPGPAAAPDGAASGLDHPEGTEEPEHRPQADDPVTSQDDAAVSGATLPVRRRSTRWSMVAGIAATLALAAGSAYLVTQSSGERRPDQGVSGGPESSPLTLLQTALDLDRQGKLVDAAKLYDAVLAEEPDNVVALSRRGWVLGRSGRQTGNVELLKAGLGYLEQATTTDPGYADAHAFKGLVLGALARPGDAVCSFRLWLAIAPIADPQRPAIEGVLDEATTQAGGTPPACPTPPVPVPLDPAAPSTTIP